MIQFSGLCSNCSNASNCTFPRNSGRPISQCEEFDGLRDRKPNNPGKTNRPSNPFSELKPEEKNPGKDLGLCRNCENRDTCKFPRQEGGIWHCEEYR